MQWASERMKNGGKHIPSKYDVYWQNKLTEIEQLLKDAHKYGRSGELNVSDITNYGKRNSWYGVVEVFENGIRKGETAHARSLGNVIIRNKLLDSFEKTVFKLIISTNLGLRAEKLDVRERIDPFQTIPVKKISHVVNENSEIRKERLVEILKEIPWETWKDIVREESEWKLMGSFLNSYGFGHFAVLIVVAGLNDYQLKGKAEKVYWPGIRKVLESSSIPKSTRDLFNILEPFYKKERLNSIKVQRLKKFLDSSLADKLWKASPQEVSEKFLDIWKELAQVMGQKPQDKTISFAMKCLGIILLMSEEYRFDFSRIPIPVDSRVRKFTQVAGLCAKNTDQEIRAVWKDILSILKKYYPDITMIHLDSLVWQIATLNSNQQREYFRNLNIPEVIEKLSTFIQTKSEMTTTKINRDQVTSMFSSKRGKVICFIPCCGSKYASGEIIKPEHILSDKDLPNTWHNLLEGRKGMRFCIDFTSPKTSAINLYTGSPYEVLSPHKKEIIELIQRGKLRLIIISAGYGIIDAIEPIHSYDEMMKGRVASHWKNANLTGVIADLLMRERPARIFGFFAGESYWSTPGSKYRYFFSEGVKTALANRLDVELCGCFYRAEGQGVKAILGSLGRTFIELLKIDFDDSYVENIYRNGRWDGNVKIGFERIKGR